MSISLDNKYARLAGAHMSKFKNTKPGFYNFRCPFCGDSELDEEKARGWFYTKDNKMKFKCHNCNHTESSVLNFLKTQVPSLYSSYLLDKFRAKSGSTNVKKPTHTSSEKYKKFKERDKYLTPYKVFQPISSNERAFEYLLNRGIGEEFHDRIYFTDKFKHITNKLYPGKFTDEKEYGKEFIIFPLLKENGEMFGYQGRCISDCTKAFRFITIVLDQKESAIYGRELIDESKTVWVHEAPIDSLFVDNSVALCGANNNIVLSYPKMVYVLDPDTRNTEIKNQIRKLIDEHKSVVILPKKYSGMDINDLVLDGHDVEKLVRKYSFSGLNARIQLNKW